MICTNDDYEIYDEGEEIIDINFRLVLTLTAEQTVYIRVRGYSPDMSGSFTIYAIQGEE